MLFEISVINEKSQNIALFSKYIDPKNNMDDRQWFDEKISLSTFYGQKVSFIFKTTGGYEGDIDYDWSGWSRLRIITKRKLKKALDPF